MNTALATIPQPSRPHQTFRVGYMMPAREFETGRDVLANCRAVHARLHPPMPPTARAVAPAVNAEPVPKQFTFVERLRKGRHADWQHAGRQAIMEEVAAQFGVTVNDIISLRRARATVDARYETFHRLTVELGYSTTMVGDAIGGRDHSTVVVGLRRRRERLEAAAR